MEMGMQKIHCSGHFMVICRGFGDQKADERLGVVFMDRMMKPMDFYKESKDIILDFFEIYNISYRLMKTSLNLMFLHGIYFEQRDFLFKKNYKNVQPKETQS